MNGITRDAAKQRVGRGWASLLDKIYDRLSKSVYVIEVKEKFGGLRVYVGGASEEFFDVIDKAEAESLTVCENCGEPGKPRDGAWIKTLCDKCEGVDNG